MELLQAAGLPFATIVSVLILAYLSKKIFEKTLDMLVEERKGELTRLLEERKGELTRLLEERKGEISRVLEERKAELSHETERLKTKVGIEAETYRLAAQKRFERLIELWESSEALFENTDFSDQSSVRDSLIKLDETVKLLNKYSVLMSSETIGGIKTYLARVGTVLTNSDNDFAHDKISGEKIAMLIKGLASPLSIISPTLSIAAEIGAAIVPSIGESLGKRRNKSALEARAQLEGIVRRELGTWITEEKPLNRSMDDEAAQTPLKKAWDIRIEL